MSARRGALVAVAVALMALLPAGCGGDDRTREFNDPVLSAAQVDRYRPGSPERSVMEMMRAIQYNVPGAVAPYFDPRRHVRPLLLARMSAGVSRILATSAPIRVVSVDRRGRHAVVVLRVGKPLWKLRMTLIEGAWRWTGVSF